VKPLSRGDKRTSSEPLDMLFDDRDLERTAVKQTNNPMYMVYMVYVEKRAP